MRNSISVPSPPLTFLFSSSRQPRRTKKDNLKQRWNKRTRRYDVMFAIWNRFLRERKVFFQLTGNSLLLIRVDHICQFLFEQSLNINDLFRRTTILDRLHKHVFTWMNAFGLGIRSIRWRSLTFQWSWKSFTCRSR